MEIMNHENQSNKLSVFTNITTLALLLLLFVVMNVTARQVIQYIMEIRDIWSW